MKTVRYGTFETNSSSTHSMIIPVERPDIAIPTFLEFHIGEFGWGVEEVNHLDYLYTAIMLNANDESQELLNRLKAVCNEYGIETSFETAQYERWEDYEGKVHFSLADGYIDHSEDLGEFLSEVFKSDASLLNFIIGGRVATGNDNTEVDNPIATFYRRLDNKEKTKYIYCSKGN